MMFSLTSKSVFQIRHFCNQPTFGLLIDIDGVIARGKKLIPGTRDTFEKCVFKDGKFTVPTVFLTNASNSLAKDKAEQLSEWLNVIVPEEQVILAHTPLKMFRDYHNNNTLILGQGPVEEIAHQIGFKKTITIDELRTAFPQLDVIDHARRKFSRISTNTKFPKIETIFLNGETVRWETSLQLLTDILITNGDPSCSFSKYIYPHIPILACNPDLHYMAEAHIPRLGNGAFLLCLEALYKKITGNKLIYTALVGKPSNTTYKYAQKIILDQAVKLNISKVNCLYAIGDNINADIFGANLFKKAIEGEVKNGDSDKVSSVQNCCSVLVKTGVFNENVSTNKVNHIHRDFTDLDKKYFKPDHIVRHISEALELIFNIEKGK